MPTRWLLSLVLLSLSVWSAGCGPSSSDEANGLNGERGHATPSVEAVQAQLGALPLEKRLSGVVRAENQVAIYPEITAPVVEVLAQNGDYVEAGAPLVRLKDTQYREQLRQAQANLRIAQAEAKQVRANVNELEAQLRRTERLAERDFQSQQQLEMLQAQVEAAEARHEQALAQVEQAEATVDEREEALRQTVVRAPISGFVGRRNAEVGMRVDGNTQLYTIGNFETVRVQIAIPDEVFGQIEVGQTALVRSPSLPDTTLEAQVSRISPFLSAESYSAEAEIDVPNPDQLLKPGMFVQVDVLYGESQQATIVPLSALYEDPNSGRLGVFVAPSLGTEVPASAPETYDEDDPPPLSEATPTTFREVEVVARGRQAAGIRGVEPGAWVVTVGQNLLNQAGGEEVAARVRAIPWQRVAALQELQDQDLLRRFMEKQQRMARERFGPSSDRAAPGSQPAVSNDPASETVRRTPSAS